MLFCPKIVLLLSLVSVGFSTPLVRSIDDVKAGVHHIATSVTALEAVIAAFPATGGTLSQAAAINAGGSALIADLKDVITVIESTGPIGEIVGNEVVSIFESFAPAIENGLTTLAALKPAFVGLGAPQLIVGVHKNLVSLRGGTVAFVDALAAVVPETPALKALGLKNHATAVFDETIAVYAP